MDKPTQTYPSVPTTAPSPMPHQIPDTSIRKSAFGQILQQRGIRFVHKKAVKCPNVKFDDARGHEPQCPLCDNSGFIYYASKEVYGVFGSNSLEKLFEIQGVWEEGTAVITFPTEYADGTQVDFCQYDKLVIPDFQVRVYELRPYEPTTGNFQRLRYPVLSVDFAAWATGTALHPLVSPTDFTIVGGKIKWVAGRQPPYNSGTLMGAVVSYSYLINPEFNVVRMMHELRATQEVIGGVKTAVRLPQEVLVKRDALNGPELIGT